MGQEIAKDTGCIYFSDFSLCLYTRQLWRGNTRVQVERRVMDLLIYLLLNHDRAIAKEELHLELWQGRPMSETVLSRCVMKARKAIGDCSQTQSMIKTIPCFGYHFIAPIHTGPEPHRPEPVQPEQAGFEKKITWTLPAPRGMWWRAVLSVAAFALLIVPYSPHHGSPTTSSRQFAVLPVQNATGDSSLDWVQLGLMNIIVKSIPHRFVVVPESTVIATLSSFKKHTSNITQDNLAAIRKRVRGSNVLIASLQRDHGLYRLNTTVYFSNNQEYRDTTVGDSPQTLAAAVGNRLTKFLRSRDPLLQNGQGPSSNPVINRLYTQGLAAEFIGDNITARGLFLRCLSLDPTFRQGQLQLAVVERKLGNWQSSADLLDKLLAPAHPAVDPAITIAARHAYGKLDSDRGRLDSAEHHFRLALALANEIGTPENSAAQRLGLAKVFMTRGRDTKARSLLNQALETYRHTQNRLGEAAALYSLAALTWKQGRALIAYELGVKALDIRRAIGARQDEAASLGQVGDIACALGKWGASKVYLDQALAISRSLKDQRLESRILVAMSKLALLQGRLGDSTQKLRMAIRLASKLKDQTTLAGVLAQRGRIAATNGDLLDAHDDLQRAYNVYAERHDRLMEALTDLEIGRIQLQRGHKNKAKTLLESAHAVGEKLEDNYFIRAISLMLSANLAKSVGKLDEANRDFREGLELARGLGNPLLVAEFSINLGHLCIDMKLPYQASAFVDQLSAWRDYYPTLALEAALHYYQGDYRAALASQRKARDIANDAWTSQNRLLLEIYGHSVNTGKGVHLKEWYDRNMVPLGPASE